MRKVGKMLTYMFVHTMSEHCYGHVCNYYVYTQMHGQLISLKASYLTRFLAFRSAPHLTKHWITLDSPPFTTKCNAVSLF